MNRLKFLLATLVVGVITLGIYSCAKDEIKNEPNANLTTENRSALPTVINGMLHFDTYVDFETYIANLQELKNDTNQVKTAYIQLGVDLTQEFLPNLTDYPVSLRKEQQLTGFTSARKAEETIINNALDSGDDSVFSIVSDPFFKSAINTDNSVHIGTRIFRFFENGGVVIVLNNNWSAFQTIRTANYASIKSTNDIFVSNDNKNNWSPIFNIDSNGGITTEKQFTDPGDNVQYHPACVLDSTKIKFTNLNDGTIRLEYTGQAANSYKWSFSNDINAVYFGNPVVVPCKGTGRVCLTIPIDFWPYVCIGCKTFQCNDNCGIKKEKKETQEWTNAGGSGKKNKIDAIIWVKDGELGCRSTHFGKNIVGIWVRLNLIFNTTGVFANISGNFKREVTSGNCIIVNQPFNEKQLPPGSANGSWQNIISQPGKNFIDPGNLSSGHRLRLKTGGTFFGFGVDRPRLILN